MTIVLCLKVHQYAKGVNSFLLAAYQILGTIAFLVLVLGLSGLAVTSDERMWRN
ncbi:hypothetical protein [Hymenobacter arizonensis]|uniref:Uncharacterized protein n=1 Tax=Hymenobacter arizonensis TaxID=1227077 RepID=A0A1I6BMX1_HYMAR|nr:hypothetical protein [Hymenobacter arizonensis]SFQ82265.1 hypothetical protein SAMN04515668_4775 [Hymenobacter arizonensis]